MLRAAKALAAWHGREEVLPQDVTDAAVLVLPHRRRRRPMDSVTTSTPGCP
jgi:magnesium chelatase subunit I